MLNIFILPELVVDRKMYSILKFYIYKHVYLFNFYFKITPIGEYSYLDNKIVISV